MESRTIFIEMNTCISYLLVQNKLSISDIKIRSITPNIYYLTVPVVRVLGGRLALGFRLRSFVESQSKCQLGEGSDLGACLGWRSHFQALICGSWQEAPVPNWLLARGISSSPHSSFQMATWQLASLRERDPTKRQSNATSAFFYVSETSH